MKHFTRSNMLEVTQPGALLRPRFFPRQVVTAADLAAGVEWIRARFRRHNQALHGFGVVHGLEVTLVADTLTVTISPGYAVTPEGDELYVPVQQTKDISCCIDASCPEATPNPTHESYLVLRYHETPATLVSAFPDRCSNKLGCEPSRLHEGFSIECQSETPAALTPPLSALDLITRFPGDTPRAADLAWSGTPIPLACLSLGADGVPVVTADAACRATISPLVLVTGNPPRVSSIVPTAALIAAAEKPAEITVVFDDDMDEETINTATFQVAIEGEADDVVGNVTYTPLDRTATFTPTNPATFPDVGRVTVVLRGTGERFMRNVAGVALDGAGTGNPGSDYTTEFTIGIPVTATTSPANNESVESLSLVTIQFSKTIKAETLRLQPTATGSPPTVMVTTSDGPISGQIVNVDDLTYQFVPAVELTGELTVSVILRGSGDDPILDQQGFALDGNGDGLPGDDRSITISVSTIVQPDTFRVRLIEPDPLLPFFGNGPEQITVTFNRAVRRDSVKLPQNSPFPTFTVTVEIGGATPVRRRGRLEFSDLDTKVAFIPEAPFAGQMNIVVRLEGSSSIFGLSPIEDTDGEALDGNSNGVPGGEYSATYRVNVFILRPDINSAFAEVAPPSDPALAIDSPANFIALSTDLDDPRAGTVPSALSALEALPGISSGIAGKLRAAGIVDAPTLAAMEPSALARMLGISNGQAMALVWAAREAIEKE